MIEVQYTEAPLPNRAAATASRRCAIPATGPGHHTSGDAGMVYREPLRQTAGTALRHRPRRALRQTSSPTTESYLEEIQRLTG